VYDNATDILLEQYMLSQGSTKYTFNTLGYLTQITSYTEGSSSLSLNISYGSGYRISRITDTAGNAIDFTYADSILNETALSIKDENNVSKVIEKIGYLYNSNRLIGIQYHKDLDGNGGFSDNENVIYSYDDNKLEIAEDSDGNQIYFYYDQANHIVEINSYVNLAPFGRLLIYMSINVQLSLIKIITL
jgi:hypothetical protein